jgi:hypothetical protein
LRHLSSTCANKLGVKGTWGHKAAGLGVCKGKLGSRFAGNCNGEAPCPDVEVRGHESDGNTEETPKGGGHLGDLAI